LHYTAPRTNARYWEPKIQRNYARDRETDRLLYEAGWRVIRIWEHEVPEDALARLKAAVRGAPLSRKVPPSQQTAMTIAHSSSGSSVGR
jgi:DNA mismatch endonuclease (patch repair protein)